MAQSNFQASNMPGNIPLNMRGVVYRGKNDLRTETLPVPAIGEGELLVKVAACGVCPTDIKKIHYGTVPAPRVFGHETAGSIVAVGGGVAGWNAGDRVALHHHVPCLDCHFCKHRAFAQCEQYKRTGITAGFEPAGGGYAEYVRVMPFVLPGVVRIPPENSFLEGAMLEPVNTVLKAVKRLHLLPGDSVLVAGQGPIGLMFTRLLALAGMRVACTDLLDSRLELAARFGASECLRIRPNDSSGLMEMLKAFSGSSSGIDAAVIAVPADQAVHDGMAAVRGGGQVLLFSHTRRGVQSAIDLANVCVDEKDLIGSYSADFLLQAEVADLVFSRRMDVRPLITHTFPLEQTPAAVDLASQPSSTSLKVAIVQD